MVQKLIFLKYRAIILDKVSLRFDFRDIFGKEFSSFLEIAGTFSVEQVSGGGELFEYQPNEFTHVHARNHFLENLTTRIYRVLIYVAVVLRGYEVKYSSFTKRTTFRVYQHVRIVRVVLSWYRALYVFQLLHVAGVASGSWNEN